MAARLTYWNVGSFFGDNHAPHFHSIRSCADTIFLQMSTDPNVWRSAACVPLRSSMIAPRWFRSCINRWILWHFFSHNGELRHQPCQGFAGSDSRDAPKSVRRSAPESASFVLCYEPFCSFSVRSSKWCHALFRQTTNTKA